MNGYLLEEYRDRIPLKFIVRDVDGDMSHWVIRHIKEYEDNSFGYAMTYSHLNATVFDPLMLNDLLRKRPNIIDRLYVYDLSADEVIEELMKL